MLMAGLSGVWEEIEPADPIEKDLSELEPEEALWVTQVVPARR